MKSVCGRQIPSNAPEVAEFPSEERTCETCFRVAERRPFRPVELRWRKLVSWHMVIVRS